METRETTEMEKLKQMETLRAKEMEKSPCLLGRGPEGEGPALYLFHLENERRSKRNFCRRCCVEVFGEDEEDEDEDGKLQRRRPGMRVITPVESVGPPEKYDMSVVVGTVLYVRGGVFPDPNNEQEWSFHNKLSLDLVQEWLAENAKDSIIGVDLSIQRIAIY